MRQCRQCHNEAEKARREGRRDKLNGKRLDYFARDVKGAADDKMVASLCRLMVHSFGGVAGFANQWNYHLTAARMERPGCKRVFDSMQAIMRLVQYDDAARRRAIKRMSVEDLNAALQRKIVQIIAEDPMVAIEAAEELGWTVEPPDEGED